MQLKFKQHIVIARSLLFCIGIMLSCNIYSATGTEQPNIFLRIGNIQGESIDIAHLGWIDVSASSFNVSIPLSGSKGSKISRANFGPISLEKAIDSATPKLFIAVAQGNRFQNVEIEFVEEATGERIVYFKVVLDDVFVQSLESAVTNGSRVEIITLAYNIITLEYTIVNEDGSHESPIRQTWNVSNNSSN